ncbi:MAG: hypothetical protein OEV26_00405 [Gallionella sp.]|nr:hypothetical protein [Gallionella sp.]
MEFDGHIQVPDNPAALPWVIIDPALKQYCFRHSGLEPDSSNSKIGALCALLYLCRINSKISFGLQLPRNKISSA